MNAKGSVFKYPDNVDTDVIIPARHLNTQDPKELASHCMEDIDKDFVRNVRDGDVMVGGWNFGCGSSREHAPVAIKAAGISVVIGSCTTGRLEDMEAAYNILKGRHIAKGVRGIIIPATMAVYKECILRGWTTAFIDAGCIVSTPTCGPCLGGYMGILAEGERCVSTTNRNFVGRMGHVKSEVYLASPATAAASALTGYITDPRTV